MRNITAIAFAALLAAGCANQPGTANTDRAFGQALNAAKAAQVVDPDAPSRVRPAPGTDGQQARTAVEQYEKSYTQPAAAGSVLGIGSGMTSTTSGSATIK